MKAETGAVQTTIPPLVSHNVDIFACPVCGESLLVSGDGRAMQCSGCKRAFDSEAEMLLGGGDEGGFFVMIGRRPLS